MEKFPLYLDGETSKFISRKSVAPFQKQPFGDVLQSRCSKNLCNNHRKAPALETLFNKVLVLQTSNFIKK